MLEARGVCCASLLSERFDNAAKLQAAKLGLASIRRVLVAHPIQDATDAEMRSKCEAVFEQVVQACTAVDFFPHLGGASQARAGATDSRL